MPVKMFGVTRRQPLTPDQPKHRPMSQFKPLPPLEELQQAFAYNPETGLFVSKVSRGSVKAGAPVGTLNKNGRVQMMLNRRLLAAHRVAWYLMTGSDPLDALVDHEDRIPSHNWFSNLRLATHKQNQGNRKSYGVSRYRNKFRAVISIDNEQIILGTFNTAEEAHKVYVNKHIEIHGSFSPYFGDV